MLDRTGNGFQSVTALVAVALEFAALTALTVTLFVAGTTAGAVYVPEALIVPVEEAPPVTPLTCHLTEVFDVPDTAALKVWVAPARTSALYGEILTVTPDPEGDELEFEPEELVVPVQLEKMQASRQTRISGECRRTSRVLRSINGDE